LNPLIAERAAIVSAPRAADRSRLTPLISSYALEVVGEVTVIAAPQKVDQIVGVHVQRAVVLKPPDLGLEILFSDVRTR
jgi:hypothetical protein